MHACTKWCKGPNGHYVGRGIPWVPEIKIYLDQSIVQECEVSLDTDLWTRVAKFCPCPQGVQLPAKSSRVQSQAHMHTAECKNVRCARRV